MHVTNDRSFYRFHSFSLSEVPNTYIHSFSSSLGSTNLCSLGDLVWGVLKNIEIPDINPDHSYVSVNNSVSSDVIRERIPIY